MEKTEATVKILILEDNLTDQLLLQAVLEEESGWQSNVADRLETALCMLREGPYDAVLADLGVPDSQGLETLRRLRQANPMLPVLVLTGHSDDALGIQAVQEGAREYLVKGETPGRVLLRTVRHCVERSRMEGRLHEIQRRQTLVVEQSPLGIIEFDLHGSITAWNPAATRILGYSEPEALGMHWTRLIGSGSGMTESDAFRDVVLHENHSGTTYLTSTRQGRVLLCEWFNTSIKDQDGKVIGVSSLCRDITERSVLEQKFQHSEAKFKSVFESMQDGYLQQDFKGTELLVNPAALDLLGYSYAELQSLSHPELFVDPVEYRQTYSELVRRGELINCRARIRRRDSVVRTFEGNVRLQKGFDERPDTMQVIFRDVTERILADEDRQARQAADEANRLKGEFLAKMSHEIRTPLNVITGMTYLALKARPSDRLRDYLDTIQLAGQNLLMIVNDILDFSKVEAGRMELEQVELNLDEVLEQMLAILAPRAAEKGIEFLLSVEAGVPSSFRGDALRLSQVLLNLIGNAIKFTAEGEVELTVRSQSQEGALKLLFEVRDTGPGISPEQQLGLFTAFSQADNSITRKYGGTGLGLAISKQLVELMGGDISLESHTGRGSTFRFTAEFGRAVSGETEAPDLTGRSVLAIGESWLGKALQALGLSVQTRAPGSDLSLPTPVPEIVFLEGPARAIPAGPKRVLIGDRRHSSDLFQEGGFDAVLLKPFTNARLRTTVLKLLGIQVQGTVFRPAPLEHNFAARRGARILLVEDNPTNSRIARELLESAGLTVDILSDGRQAVDALLNSPTPCPWQLVLMDLQMPVLDGYSAAELIRAEPRFNQLPVLAMSAHVLEEERRRCRTVGMDDYISKPIDPEALYATLNRWLPGTSGPVHSEPGLQFLVVAGLDSAGGLRRLAGNVNLYRMLLLDMARQQETLVNSLRDAWTQGNIVQVGEQAHRLKGMTGNLGLTAIQFQAAELEIQLKQGSPQEVTTCLEELVNLLKFSSDDILATLTEPTTPPVLFNALVDPEALDRLSGELLALLRASDGAAPDTLTRLTEMVRSDPGPSSRLGLTEARLRNLGQMVEQYNYSAAVVELQSWMV